MIPSLLAGGTRPKQGAFDPEGSSLFHRLEIDFWRTPVTLLVIGVAASLELLATLQPSMRVELYETYHLGLDWRIWQGEVWQPVTTCLLHGDLLHAAFNLLWLLLFGTLLEQRYGSLRFLGLLVLLGYASSLPEYVISNYRVPVEEQHGLVGMSGVVYGLFGILWIGRYWKQEFYAWCDDQTALLFLGWFFFCVVMTRAGRMNVANVAHLGGVAFGVLYGEAIYNRAQRWLWRPLSVVATLIVLASLVAVPGHRGYEHACPLRAPKRAASHRVPPSAVPFSPAIAGRAWHSKRPLEYTGANGIP